MRITILKVLQTRLSRAYTELKDKSIIDLNLEERKNDDVAVIITKIKTAKATRKLGRLEFLGMP